MGYATIVACDVEPHPPTAGIEIDTETPITLQPIRIRQVKAAVGHMVKVCCEVDRIDQIEHALAAGADVLLLDNMGPEMLAEAVRLIAGRAVVEASGKVSLDTVGSIAASGVDVISVGRLTHSAPALDIALDFDG